MPRRQNRFIELNRLLSTKYLSLATRAGAVNAELISIDTCKEVQLAPTVVQSDVTIKREELSIDFHCQFVPRRRVRGAQALILYSFGRQDWPSRLFASAHFV